MQDVVRDKDELGKNIQHTKDNIKQKEARIEYFERLLNMVNMAGDALGDAAGICLIFIYPMQENIILGTMRKNIGFFLQKKKQIAVVVN